MGVAQYAMMPLLPGATMTDQTTPQDAANVPNSSTDSGATSEPQDVSQLPAWAQKLIKEANREAAGYRTKAKERDEALRAAEEKRLADQQEWQKLAETRAAELDRLKPLQERLDAIETATRENNEQRIAALPENMRTLVPADYEPLKLRNWLDANAQLFATPRAPITDAGVTGDRSKQTPITDEERRMMQLSGMTEAQFREYKDKKPDTSGFSTQAQRLTK